MSARHLGPLEFLVILNVILLAMGCFLDGLSMLVISLPLIFPVAVQLGINLFVLSGISRLRVEEIVHALLPFYVFLLVGLAVLTYFPALSTWLPGG